MIEHIAAIFDIGLAFITGFITAVKKDKSWVMVDWNTRDVAQLLHLLICQHKAGLVGHNRYEEVLMLIYKYWGHGIVTLYRAYHKREKTLRQLCQVARNNFSSTDSSHLVNSKIVKKSYLVNPHRRLYSKFGYVTGINWKP